MTIASDILTEAAGIVAGARNVTHGDKERSFAVIAGLWNEYLLGKKELAWLRPLLKGKPLVETVDAPQMMVLQKIARTIQGVPIQDHFTDECGYAAIAGEISTSCQPSTKVTESTRPTIKAEPVYEPFPLPPDPPKTCYYCGGTITAGQPTDGLCLTTMPPQYVTVHKQCPPKPAPTDTVTSILVGLPAPPIRFAAFDGNKPTFSAATPLQRHRCGCDKLATETACSIHECGECHAG